jgi:hypothetical protein
MQAAILAMCVWASAGTTPAGGSATPRTRTMGVRAELGVGTSNGVLGAVIWRDLAPVVRIEGGAGVGLSGLQLSTLMRLLVGGDSHRFVPGAGVSLGLPVGGSSIFKQRHDGPAIVMPWLNVAPLGYEYRSANGWTFALELGATTPLRRGHWDLVDDFGGTVQPLEDWYPGGHFGIGKAF